MFVKSNEPKKSVTGGLAYTSTLVVTSERLVEEVMTAINSDTDKYEATVIESQKDNDIMDDLITETIDIDSVDLAFLEPATTEEITRMIKSQQSKRSRTKQKEMTVNNYRTLLNAGISEMLLRIAGNMPKQSAGRRTSIAYSEEELERFRANADELERAIRNVQSKKSIERRKEDFDEENPTDRYNEILETEEQLKAIRDEHRAAKKKAEEKSKEIASKLELIEVDKLKADDARQLLEETRKALLSL